MNSQHTPGPWQFNDLDASIWPGPMGSRRAPVATVFTAAQPESELSQESDHFTPEEAANARLIAAAPELLEALVEMLIANHGLPANENDEHDPVRARAVVQARAAIAKATKATGGAQ